MRNTFLHIAAIVAVFGLAATALAQTKTAPQLQTAPRLQTTPKLAVPKRALIAPSPVGKRVVRGLDYALANTAVGAGGRTDSTVRHVVGENDSVIIFYGTVNMGNTEYYSVAPDFPTQYQLFSGRPQGCVVNVTEIYQHRTTTQGYKFTYKFKDIGAKKECGDYFRSLRSLRFVIASIRVRTVSNWQQPERRPAASSGETVVTLPAIAPLSADGRE